MLKKNKEHQNRIFYKKQANSKILSLLVDLILRKLY